jgi:zinc transporter 1/2/3
LQAANGTGAGGAAVAASDGELIDWNGYRLATRGRQANWAVDDALAPERPRHVGAAGANRLVGGVFLHTTRRPPAAPCVRGSVAAMLGFDCAVAAASGGVTFMSNASAAAALAAWLTARSNGVNPYGIDPAFLRSSSLYRPDLIGREGLYYNTSDSFEVSAATKTPYGFFYKRLAGYADGFPILLPNRMGSVRAGEAVQYLLDGNYLDG